jgi:hypothetical protein
MFEEGKEDYSTAKNANGSPIGQFAFFAFFAVPFSSLTRSARTAKTLIDDAEP